MTTLPILIHSHPANRDGEVTFRYWTGVTRRDFDRAIEAGVVPERDLTTDIRSVRILPSYGGAQADAMWSADFKRAFDKLPDKDRSDLKAFLELIPIQTLSPKRVLEYMRRKTRFEKERVWNVQWAKQTLRERMRYPLAELAAQLNQRMAKARFVMWWVDKEKKFAPGIYCPDLSTALAASLVSHIAAPKAVAICERCENRFIRTKSVQRFCSLRCGNADRKARQRAKG